MVEVEEMEWHEVGYSEDSVNSDGRTAMWLVRVQTERVSGALGRQEHHPPPHDMLNCVLRSDACPVLHSIQQALLPFDD